MIIKVAKTEEKVEGNLVGTLVSFVAFPQSTTADNVASLRFTEH